MIQVELMVTQLPAYIRSIWQVTWKIGRHIEVVLVEEMQSHISKYVTISTMPHNHQIINLPIFWATDERLAEGMDGHRVDRTEMAFDSSKLITIHHVEELWLKFTLRCSGSCHCLSILTTSKNYMRQRRIYYSAIDRSIRGEYFDNFQWFNSLPITDGND